jgi:hypothetical protein
MFKTNSLSNKKVTVALIEKEEYLKIIRDDEKQIFPIVLKFLNGINVMKIYGFNNYFTDVSDTRIIVKKKDGSSISDNEFNEIRDLSNVDYVEERDILLDNYLWFESDYDKDYGSYYINGIFKDIFLIM